MAPHTIANCRYFAPAFSLLLLLPLLSLAAAIPARAQDSAPVIDTTVCELTAHPGQFDGKMVRVKVQFVSPRNTIKDADSQCPSTIRLAFRAAAPASSSPSSSTSTRDIPRPTYIEDDQFELLNKYRNLRMHQKWEGASCSPCNRYDEITATLTGMVNFLERGSHVFDGPPPDERLFFVRSVADVKARDLAATYDPNLYSTEPLAYPTAFLSGKLLAPDGKPLPRTTVDVHPVGPPSSSHGINTQRKTDDQGQFAFAIPPGTYVLAINSVFGPSSDMPYDVTYYPATTDIASAEVFQLSADQHVDDVTFSLAAAEPLPQRNFSGKVVWPDGRVAPDAVVWLSETGRDAEIAFPGASTTTDANGNFSVSGFKGKDYFVHAKTVVDREPATAVSYALVCAQKIRVNSTAPSDAVNLTLTVEGSTLCIQQ